MSNATVTFGLPEEWESFKVSHQVFLKKLDSLYALLHKVFIREYTSSEPADSVVFFLGRLCVEDFNEILLLCGNGCGVGGQKLLRGLYERCVTMGYIAKQADEATTFLGYHAVHQGKLLNHMKAAFDIRQLFPEERINNMMQAYSDARSEYEEVICKKCGTKRLRFSWSSLDILSMARAAQLDQLYLQCYYEPTLQAHATVSALVSRMKLNDNAHVCFDEGRQRGEATATLCAAHRLILYVIDTQDKYFKLSVDQLLKESESDFHEVWKTKGNTTS